MEQQSYSSLFESIRVKCQREGWYGPQFKHLKKRMCRGGILKPAGKGVF